MKKIIPFKMQKLPIYFFLALFFSLLYLISGCGDGSIGNPASNPPETASATFSITWHELVDTPVQASNMRLPNKALVKNQSVVTAQAESVDCNLIGEIECIVYDGSNNHLTSATFECSAHQGTVDNIPVGSSRKFVCLGVEANGNTLYHGEITGVTISAGQTNNLGTIDAYYFVPVDLSVAAVSPNRIDLSWGASPDDVSVKGYNIYRDGAFLKSVSSTSTSDTGLSPSTQYCYRVSAYDETGNESGQSNRVCATTAQTVDGEDPTIPTGLSADAVSSDQIALSWNVSTDNVSVAGYNVYRNGTFLRSVSATSTNDTGLDVSTRYCYRVSAFDGAGNESGQSNQSCATTSQAVDSQDPTIPTGLSADAVSSDQIALTWNASTDNVGVAGYNIYRNETFLKSVTSTSTSDTGLTPLTQYCYQVSAYDAAGNKSGQSSQVCATTLPPPDSTAPSPDPMTWMIEPHAESTSEISMWATTALDPSSPVTYMFDFVGSPTGGSGGIDSVWMNSTSYGNYGLDTNQQYGYRVQARDGEGNTTNYSSALYAYTLANTPNGYEYNFEGISITGDSISVYWRPNGNPDGTEYYCENIDAGTNSGWTTATSWNSTGLMCETSYRFRVMARNGDGIVTGWYVLGSESTPFCENIAIRIGDNDGYGYGIQDYADLPQSTDPNFNWIFDNREATELSANDGSQHTDYEPYNSRQFSFNIEISPVNPSVFDVAVFGFDVSGIQETVFGASSLHLDGIDYSDYLPESQGGFGSDVAYIYIYDPSMFEDGKLTVEFQGGLGLDPNVWDPDAIAFDFFELDIYYYGE